MKNSGVSGDHHYFGEQSAGLIHDSAADVGQGVSEPVESKFTPLVPCHFKRDKTEKHRNREDDEIHSLKLIRPLCIA